jgi:hypothetical protein
MTRTLGELLTKVRPEEPPAAAPVTPFERATFPRVVSRAATIAVDRPRSELPVSGAESTARLIDEAYERGKRDGVAVVQTEYDVKLAEQKAQHVMKVAVDRHRATAENARVMADRLAGVLQEMETGICDSVAALLVPFVAENVRRQAIDDLARTLSRMVAERRPATIKVEGPSDLLGALKGALGDFPVPIEYTAAASLAYDPLESQEGRVDSIEVQDERVVRTEIGAWLERLRGATQ